MALNSLVFTESVVKSFLRCQLTAHALADERLNRQMRELLARRDTTVARSAAVAAGRQLRSWHSVAS